MVRLEGFEPPTYWFVASHSIQLSYSRIFTWPNLPATQLYYHGIRKNARGKCKKIKKFFEHTWA